MTEVTRRVMSVSVQPSGREFMVRHKHCCTWMIEKPAPLHANTLTWHICVQKSNPLWDTTSTHNHIPLVTLTHKWRWCCMLYWCMHTNLQARDTNLYHFSCEFAGSDTSCISFVVLFHDAYHFLDTLCIQRIRPPRDMQWRATRKSFYHDYGHVIMYHSLLLASDLVLAHKPTFIVDQPAPPNPRVLFQSVSWTRIVKWKLKRKPDATTPIQSDSFEPQCKSYSLRQALDMVTHWWV